MPGLKYTDLLTTIIGDLNRGDASISDIVMADVRGAIRNYEGQRFWFNEMELTFTLSIQQYYPLSIIAAAGAGIDDLLEIDVFQVTVNNNRTYQMEEVPWNKLTKIDSGVGTLQGYPQIYAYFNRQVKIYPRPNQLYTGIISAHVKFVDPTTGDAGFQDSTPWCNEAAELIRCATLKSLWARRFRDTDAAMVAQEMEDQALLELRRKTDAISGRFVQGVL